MSAFQWIAGNPSYMPHPLVFYALLAAGLGLCLYLFITLQGEIGGLRRRRLEEQRRVEALEAALDQTRRAIQGLELDLRDVEQQTGMLVAPAPAKSGLNLTKRTQVLRLHRSGQDSASIAAALALPRAEVDLLVKVHKIVVEQI